MRRQGTNSLIVKVSSILETKPILLVDLSERRVKDKLNNLKQRLCRYCLADNEKVTLTLESHIKRKVCPKRSKPTRYNTIRAQTLRTKA